MTDKKTPTTNDFDKGKEIALIGLKLYLNNTVRLLFTEYIKKVKEDFDVEKMFSETTSYLSKEINKASDESFSQIFTELQEIVDRVSKENKK